MGEGRGFVGIGREGEGGIKVWRVYTDKRSLQGSVCLSDNINLNLKVCTAGIIPQENLRYCRET